MNSAALGAKGTKNENIIFISNAHENFYYEKLKEVRYQDEYHKALCYCLGINADTRKNILKCHDGKELMGNGSKNAENTKDRFTA